MQAIILDTETHTLNGQPIEIAYAPIQIQDGKISLDKSQIFDQLYQVDEPISFAAMAVHHILESDLIDQPHYSSFELPAETTDIDIILTANILMHEVHQLQIQSIEELYTASEEARIPQIINFGKHRGTAIADLPADYVQWLLRQEDLDPYLRKALENTSILTL